MLDRGAGTEDRWPAVRSMMIGFVREGRVSTMGRFAVVVKKIGVLSAGKVTGALYALVGLVFGAIFALFSLLGAAVGVASSQSSDALVGLLFGVGSVVFLPIFYGALGFVFGLLTALLYNLVARFVGGIQVEVEPRDRV